MSDGYVDVLGMVRQSKEIADINAKLRGTAAFRRVPLGRQV